jgi:hypothetical protein
MQHAKTYTHFTTQVSYIVEKDATLLWEELMIPKDEKMPLICVNSIPLNTTLPKKENLIILEI